jgi:hypothetical protein
VSIKRKILLISFIFLTIFSSTLLGYTLYATLGIRLATKSIQVSIRDVNINSESSEVAFHMAFRNTVNVYLGVKYVKVDIFLNNTKVQTNEYGYSDNPIELPAGVDKEFTVVAKINGLDVSPNNIWKLNIFAIFLTSLPQQASITRSISYGG